MTPSITLRDLELAEIQCDLMDVLDRDDIVLPKRLVRHLLVTERLARRRLLEISKRGSADVVRLSHDAAKGTGRARSAD